MIKVYSPTANDLSVLSFLASQTESVTVKEVFESGICGDYKDTQYSVTKLTLANFIEMSGQRAQTNPDGSPKRGRPARLIAINQNGREALAYFEPLL